jgi:hypothetical protein
LYPALTYVNKVKQAVAVQSNIGDSLILQGGRTQSPSTARAVAAFFFPHFVKQA